MQSSRKKARRDKKVLLNEQCKEIEKNNRMGASGGDGIPDELFKIILIFDKTNTIM